MTNSLFQKDVVLMKNSMGDFLTLYYLLLDDEETEIDRLQDTIYECRLAIANRLGYENPDDCPDLAGLTAASDILCRTIACHCYYHRRCELFQLMKHPRRYLRQREIYFKRTRKRAPDV